MRTIELIEYDFIYSILIASNVFISKLTFKKKILHENEKME